MANDPNNGFKVRLNGEAGFRILLSKKDSSALGQVQAPTPIPAKVPGVLRKRRPVDNILGRTPSNYVNFWDLGQIRNEEDSAWVDHDYTKAPVITINPISGLITMDPYTDWATLAAMVLSVPAADWKTHFRKLGYADAERYGLDLYNDPSAFGGDEFPVGRNGSRKTLIGNDITDTKWTSSGLKLDGTLNPVSFGSYGAFQWMSAGTGADVKVTTSPTYASTGVSLPGLKPKADVFLMPRVDSWVGNSFNNIDTNDFMVGPYQVQRRQVFLDMNYLDTGAPAYSVNYAGSLSSFSAANNAAMVALPKSSPDSIGIRQVGAAVPTLYPAAVSGFPTFYPTGESTLYVDAVTGFINMTLVYEGDFLGAIFQDGTLYYIWSTVTGGKTSDTRVIDLNIGGLP